MKVKILFSNDPPLIKYGIAEGFKELGHDTKIIGLWKVPVDRQEQYFQDVIDDYKPDFVFAEGHAVGVNLDSFFAILKRKKVPLVYWAIEDPILFTSFSRVYADNALLTFTTMEELVPQYQALGHLADTLLFGCNPKFHQEVAANPLYQHDMVLVASNYSSRSSQAAYLLRPLLEYGLDLKVFGVWWDDNSRDVYLPPDICGGILPYEELPVVYSSAKIVLGLHVVTNSKSQTSMRTYEVLGCGAFYLTAYTLAHEKLFEFGKHLVWSHNGKETINLVLRFLEESEERKQIAKQGQQLVYERDNYKNRAEKVVKLVSRLL